MSRYLINDDELDDVRTYCRDMLKTESIDISKLVYIIELLTCIETDGENKFKRELDRWEL